MAGSIEFRFEKDYRSKMAVFETFSKRKKQAARNGSPDVYQYDTIPERLKNQIIIIANDSMGVTGERSSRHTFERWKIAYDIIKREFGILEYSDYVADDIKLRQLFLKTNDFDSCMDIIEIIFKVINHFLNVKNSRLDELGSGMNSSDAIEELNKRFKEHDFGYQFDSNNLIRVDSTYIHSEIVINALRLLSEEKFSVANDDFIKAHKHYRSSENQACVVAAQRAFESTLKAICVAKNWQFKSGDRASELISIVKSKNLFPEYLNKGFDTYISMMKTGLPDVRNNAGGHGAEPSSTPVPNYIAAYALHMSATNIVLLGQAYKEL